MSDRMELPHQEDYDDMELFEHDMNMWVDDHLYGEEEDEYNRQREWEYEQEWWLYDQEGEDW